MININLIFILIALCCVVPLLYILAASFTDEVTLAKEGYSLWPSEFSVEAYKDVFRKSGTDSDFIFCYNLCDGSRDGSQHSLYQYAGVRNGEKRLQTEQGSFFYGIFHPAV